MRALIAAPFYPPRPGGIERYTAGVAGELCRRGWNVEVVHAVTDGNSAARTVGPAGERLQGLQSRVVAGRLPFPTPGRRNAQVMRQLRDASYDFTLIQSHLFLSNLLVARAVAPDRTVWLNHGSGHIPTGHRVSDKLVAGYEHVLARQLRGRVAATAGVSREAAAWLSHLGVDTDSSVGNAVAAVAAPRQGRRPGPLRVVYVGRLEPNKGALEAIRMVRDLPSSAEVELTICGDGTIAAQVEREARGSGTPVTTTGSVSHQQVTAHLAEADLFLYPSTYPEGFPTVLLEAGAAGCAVLSYRVGGTAELLEGGGGWCVTGPTEAGAVIADLAREPGRTTAVGEVLRRTVESRYTWKSVVDRLLHLGGVCE
jgi:glycosyltransferase involved in cell wall biosynthesis